MICGECKQKFVVLNQRMCFHGVQLHMLYEYNHFMETLLFQYKEGKDIALRHVFLYEVIDELEKKFQKYTLVLPPSSKQKEEERGFHAVAKMLEGCRLQKVEAFVKVDNYKQSTQSFLQRKLVKEHIQYVGIQQSTKKRLLVVDDVCTSGETLKAMIQLLQKEYEHVEAFVLAVHPKFLQEVQSCLKKGVFSLEVNEKV